MSSQFYSNRIGIESLTPAQMKYWKDQGKTYRPILEYRPLTKEEEDRLNKEYYEKNNRVGYESCIQQSEGRMARVRQVNLSLARPFDRCRRGYRSRRWLRTTNQCSSRKIPSLSWYLRSMTWCRWITW